MTPLATLAEKELIDPASSLRVSDNANSPDRITVAIRLSNGHRSPWWAAPIESRLEQLVNLETDWNSHGARRVSAEAVYLAVRVIASLLALDERRPMPQVVATWQGGLQLEWHLQNSDVEITIDPGGSVWAYLAGDDGTEEDGALTEMEGKVSAILAHA